MMKTGLLVISNPNVIHRTLPKLQSEIHNILYIQYFPKNKWHKNFTLNNVNMVYKKPNWPLYSPMIIGLYSKVLPYKHLDIRILLSGIKCLENNQCTTKNCVDFVYYDRIFSKEDVYGYICSYLKNKASDIEVTPITDEIDTSFEDNTILETDNNINGVFDHVVLGGTFDRLHYGHKILLSEAVLRCRKKITVGVTDTPMLKSKKLWELVEPCELRILKVREFLEEVDPSLEYDVVPISDIYGPTKDDPTFQMIVVSSETTMGGLKVNEVREANGLNCLSIHEVELLPDPNKEDEVEEDKISSSNLRLRCLGTLLKPPLPNHDIPERPYVVGLTGIIGSGKSSVAKYLGGLGAGLINCDLLAHDLYGMGTDGYTQVVAAFGEGILDETGAVNRKKLGEIVFNDEEKLKKLQQLLWPMILQEAKAQAQQLYLQGHSVVIMEAAVLITAGWHHHCHETWVTIIPPEEAIKRVMERNRLTEEEAKARLAAQPPNSEYVQVANVVFSTYWRQEYTHKQLDKAWSGLLERVKLQQSSS